MIERNECIDFTKNKLNTTTKQNQISETIGLSPITEIAKRCTFTDQSFEEKLFKKFKQNAIHNQEAYFVKFLF